MRKFYRVPLYEYRNNEIIKIDDIIIERGFFGGTREVVSELYIDEYWGKTSPTEVRRKIIETDMKNRGYYLFVRKKDMKKENIVTHNDVREYVNTFGERPIKKVVCSIFATEEKVKSKIKE